MTEAPTASMEYSSTPRATGLSPVPMPYESRRGLNTPMEAMTR